MKSAHKLVAVALSLAMTFMGVALVTAPVTLAGSAPTLTGTPAGPTVTQSSQAPATANRGQL